MYIERVEVEGFAGLDAAAFSLERVALLDGPPRARRALTDALLIGASAWDSRALQLLLEGWGCSGVVIEGALLPEGAHWERAVGVSALVQPDAPALQVGLVLVLDPPLFRSLRTFAQRDPRLVEGLADSRVSIRVGARFSPTWDAIGIDLLGFEIGDASFPVAGPERPAWLTPFLRGLKGRVYRGLLPDSGWVERARSWKIEHQRSVQQALQRLELPPASLGEAVMMPEGPAVLAEGVVPIAHFGAEGQQAAGVIGAVLLSGAEILVFNPPPVGAEWLSWLRAQAEAESSVLEQLVLLGVPGGHPLG